MIENYFKLKYHRKTILLWLQKLFLHFWDPSSISLPTLNILSLSVITFSIFMAKASLSKDILINSSFDFSISKEL